MNDYDRRVRQLYDTPKAALAAYYRERSSMVWSATPPERWNRDELVNEILAIEFPAGGKP
jgi:hypothetical protein